MRYIAKGIGKKISWVPRRRERKAVVYCNSFYFSPHMTHATLKLQTSIRVENEKDIFSKLMRWGAVEPSSELIACNMHARCVRNIVL